MVCLFSSDSQWFKSYGGSNIKIMAQALKMGVPRPNDTGVKHRLMLYVFEKWYVLKS